jgi:hypothetical protein
MNPNLRDLARETKDTKVGLKDARKGPAKYEEMIIPQFSETILFHPSNDITITSRDALAAAVVSGSNMLIVGSKTENNNELVDKICDYYLRGKTHEIGINSTMMYDYASRTQDTMLTIVKDIDSIEAAKQNMLFPSLDMQPMSKENNSYHAIIGSSSIPESPNFGLDAVVANRFTVVWHEGMFRHHDYIDYKKIIFTAREEFPAVVAEAYAQVLGRMEATTPDETTALVNKAKELKLPARKAAGLVKFAAGLEYIAKLKGNANASKLAFFESAYHISRIN